MKNWIFIQVESILEKYVKWMKTQDWGEEFSNSVKRKQPPEQGGKCELFAKGGIIRQSQI